MAGGSKQPDPDPFDGLILDESFVERAHAKEAAAHERMARARRIAREHGLLGSLGDAPEEPGTGERARTSSIRRPDAPQAGTAARLGSVLRRQLEPGPNRRRWLLMVAVLALAALVWVFLGGRESRAPARSAGPATIGPASSSGGGGAAGSRVPASKLTATTSTLRTASPSVGKCLAPAASATALVAAVSSCKRLHGQEIVSVRARVAAPTAAYPDAAAGQRLARKLCLATAADYVNDPSGLVPGGLGYVLNLPTQAAWAQGDRAGWCAVVTANGTPRRGSAFDLSTVSG